MEVGVKHLSAMPSGFSPYSQLLTTNFLSRSLILQCDEHPRGGKRDLVQFNYVLADSSDFWNLRFMPLHRWLA